MAVSTWLSRLRSSSAKPIAFIQTSFTRSQSHSRILHHTIPITSNNNNNSTNHRSWTASFLPIILAVTGGSLAYQSKKNPSFCDAPNLQERGVRIGGKDSTENVVEGDYKPVPAELISELRAICQENMTLDYDERYFHGKPQYSFHKAVNIPDVVVFPRSEDDVSKIVRSCNKHKVQALPLRPLE